MGSSKVFLFLYKCIFALQPNMKKKYLMMLVFELFAFTDEKNGHKIH